MGVYLRGETWWIDYYFEGSRVREPAGNNKKAAVQALAKRQADILEGNFFAHRNETPVLFKDFVKEYWELHGKYKRTKSYRLMLNQLLPHFGETPLSKITVPMVLGYRNIVKERTTTSTANRHHSFLRSMLYKAIQWGKLRGENPAAKIKLDREPNHRLRFLSKEEIARLLEACHPRLLPVVGCALMTGMRKGEIINLCWENVDLKHGIIYVLESKSGKPREIPIASKLAFALRESGPRQNGPVFHVPEIMIRRFFAKALESAHIAEFRFHDLRHTFASHYIMSTGDMPSLQRILGHQSPMMTQRYAHLATNHLRQGMEKFDSGMVTIWSQNRISSDSADLVEREKYNKIPLQMLSSGDVAQRLERAFHKR